MSDTDKLIAEIRSWAASVHDPIETYPNTLLIAAADALEASRTPAPDRAGLIESFRRAVLNDATDRTPESAAAVEEARGWLLAPVTPAEGETEVTDEMVQAALVGFGTFPGSMTGEREKMRSALLAALARRSPVETEENWEYGATNVDDDRPASIRKTLAEAREAQEFYTRDRGRKTNLFKRTPDVPAGPWLPVTEEKKP